MPFLRGEEEAIAREAVNAADGIFDEGIDRDSVQNFISNKIFSKDYRF